MMMLMDGKPVMLNNGLAQKVLEAVEHLTTPVVTLDPGFREAPVANWWQSAQVRKTYCDKLQLALKVLGQRLVDAGFEDQDLAQSEPSSLSKPNSFAAGVRYQFGHPDFDIPFVVELTLRVAATGDSGGEALLALKLADDWTCLGSYGVLQDHSLTATQKLRHPIGFGTAPYLDLWHPQGLELLTAETMSMLFDLVVAHLDKVATP